MPPTNLAVDALGAVTICLVVLLVLFGLFCVTYTLYFGIRIQRSGFLQLGYFNGPWIVRITFIAFGICWGAGEVVRLSFFRQEGRVFHALDQKWQENMCKLYILSNLGFTEPCLFLTMSFLLHASLKWRGSGILSHKWNIRTTAYVFLYCLPVFVLDFLFVLVAPKLKHGKINVLRRLPEEFTSTYLPLIVSGRPVIACTYPVLCTVLHGLFSVVLTTYLLLLGGQMVGSVINKKLQRRVYILISLVSTFLPLRVLLLGFSIFARHEHLLFEILAFFGFCVLLSCVVVGIWLLVYLPVSDSLALTRGLGFPTVAAGGRRSFTSAGDYAESLSLIAANQSHLEASTPPTHGRNSDASAKRGSVSFRALVNNEASSTGVVDEEEMISFSPGFRLLSDFSPGSPAVPRITLPSL
uniref:Transmembrane protein n=1 Tax=Opuntia streptacantha TaxID=393608 RepID=A0A7C8YV85_OPUST